MSILYPDLIKDAAFRRWAEKTRMFAQPRVRDMLLALIDGAQQGDVAVRFKVTRARANGLWLRAARSYKNDYLPATEAGVLGHRLFADMPVAELYLPTRAENCLKYEGITTLGQLTRVSAAELMRVPNFGKTSLREIQEALYAYGVGLAA